MSGSLQRARSGDEARARSRLVHVVVGDGFAGTEAYVCRAASALAADGWQVTVVGGAASRMRQNLDDAVAWLPGSSVTAAMRSLWSVGPVEVVHAHMTAAELTCAALRLRSRGQFVSTRHFAARRGSSMPARRLSPLLNHLLDRQIAISDFVAHRLETPPDVVIPHGLPRQERSSDDPTKTVLLLQRLEVEKETDTALRAWALSGLDGQGWRLRIAGEGSRRQSLELLVDELGIHGSVEFLGFVDDPLRLLQDADVLVATAPAEPFGLSVLEAMSVATAVVACGSGGHLETVGRAPGALLFAPGDAAELAQHLVTLADEPAVLRTYGQQLQQLQREHFSEEQHTAQLTGVYGAHA